MTVVRAPTTIFTSEQLSPHKRVTPEGFMLVTEVALARVGELIYKPGEVELEEGDDGLIHVFRTPEQLFDPQSIASLNGKPITMLHPNDGIVDTENWSHLSNGFVLNPRPNADRTLLVGDLLICTEEAMNAVESSLNEISLGYVCRYVQTGPGRGEARGIIYNHVALVPRGRCGAKCTVHDHAPGGDMNVRQKLMALFKSGDEAGLQTLLNSSSFKAVTGDDEPDDSGGTHVHIHTGGEGAGPAAEMPTNDDAIAAVNGRCDEHEKVHEELRTEINGLKDLLSQLLASEEEDEEDDEEEDEEVEEMEGEGEVKDALDSEIEEMEPEEKKEAKVSKDSGFLEETFQDVAAVAEIIHPGIKVPTFDAEAAPNNTAIKICGLRRRALHHGLTGDAKPFIEQARNGRKAVTKDGLKAMPCGKVTALFDAVGALMSDNNNRRGATHDAQPAIERARGERKTGFQSTQTRLADINKHNRDFWKDK